MTKDKTEKMWLSHYAKMDRRDFMITSLAAGAMTLSPRVVSAQAGAPYRIGLLLPSTGAGANYMAECIRGMPVLAAEINKKGGLLGKHPIEIIYRDDQTKPDVGAREARQLILNEKVNAIFGVYSSAVALAVQEITHEHKTLHFAATSNSSTITTENHTRYTYQWCPDSDMQSGAVVVAVSKLVKDRNWKKFVSIGQDYEWGRATHKGFTTGLAKVAPDAKEAKQLCFKLGETDFTSYISAIMAEKPDFIYPAIAGKDNETFIQQAQASGLLKVAAYPGGLISVTELREQLLRVQNFMLSTDGYGTGEGQSIERPFGHADPAVAGPRLNELAQQKRELGSRLSVRLDDAAVPMITDGGAGYRKLVSELRVELGEGRDGTADATALVRGMLHRIVVSPRTGAKDQLIEVEAGFVPIRSPADRYCNDGCGGPQPINYVVYVFPAGPSATCFVVQRSRDLAVAA